MQFLRDCFFIDKISLFMIISSLSLFLISLIFILYIAYKRYNNKNLFKLIDQTLEYKISEIFNLFFASLTLFSLVLVRYIYFARLDDVLDSLWLLLGITFLNIILKIFCIFSKIKEKNKPIKILFLRLFDNFILIITITLSSSIIAAQIPIVDISKFFGSDVSRFSLINLPFLFMTLFINFSCLSILLQYFIKNKDTEIKQNINDFLKVILPLIISLGVTIFYPLSYNLFIIICLGILSKYITEKCSLFLNLRKNFGKNHILEILTPISNILFSSFIDIIVLTILVFTCLNYGGFLGIAFTSIGLISSIVLTSSLNVFDKNSEVYKYLAKTINNILLFYIFFETLEFIYKTQININLFSDNVIIGLLTGIILILFNMLKAINLVKYVNMSTSRVYLAIRTFLYIIFFTWCVSYLLPYINYELLGALVLGLLLSTIFVSILSINAIDVFEIYTTKSLQLTTVLRNTVLPLINQVTTILIIITILLLQIIK